MFGEQDVNVDGTEVLLTDLREFHQYVVRVVAYNVNGPGPATEELTCRTFSDGSSVVLASSTLTVNRYFWRRLKYRILQCCPTTLTLFVVTVTLSSLCMALYMITGPVHLLPEVNISVM